MQETGNQLLNCPGIFRPNLYGGRGQFFPIFFTGQVSPGLYPGQLFIYLLIGQSHFNLLSCKKSHWDWRKNKMWQMQIILGERVNSILLDKFKNLSFRLLLLQIIEALVFLVLARRSDYFHMTGGLALRFGLVNLSALMVNLFFLGFFMIVEMKAKKVYTLSFLSIIGGLTGIISMLTSKILTYINPFAWMASLMNLSYVKEGDRFVQVLNPLNFYTLIIALVLLTTSLAYLRTMKFYRLWKD